VLARPGDWVDISEENMRVSGQPIAQSARLVADRAGRSMPLPPAAGAVPTGHVWLFSGHAPESFEFLEKSLKTGFSG